jgi:hypothetical protein
MVGQGDQRIGRLLPFHTGLVGVNPDAAPDIVEPLGDRPHPLEFTEMGANCDHGANAIGASARHDIFDIVAEILEIQMAVTIDKHA